MSRKNFKVATAESGKTPTQDTKHKFSNVTKTPTGKVKTIKDREAIKKAREEEYKNRRVNSLKRRAKRIGLNEEQTKVKVEELLKQLNTPNSYDVLIFYNPNNRKMVEEALKNEGLTCKIIADTYLFIEADQETLGTLREIIPPGSKIHPYVKKKQPILPVEKPKSRGKKTKTKAQKKAMAAAAKLARKKNNIAAHLSHKKHSELRKAEHCKKIRAINKAKKLFDKRCQKASKKKSGTVVVLANKKPSESPKKASTGLKVRHHKYTNAA